MAKTKTVKKVEDEKPLSFLSASMTDGVLSPYSFEVKHGVGVGFVHKIQGKGLFKDSLANAFVKLNVHLAAIDDVFKHAEVEIPTINKMRTNELTFLYTVDSFKITTTGDEESVVLSGSKRVSSSGSWMSITTPKIPLDKMSSYEYAKELREVLDDVREEVELYHNGNFTEQEKEEKVDKRQMKIGEDDVDQDFDENEGRV